jgi:hypothetical protein
MTAPEQCHEAAEEAVKRVFAVMGVDIDRPESVAEFQDDLRFGRRLRRAADQGWLAIVGAFAVALAAALWMGVTAALGGGR